MGLFEVFYYLKHDEKKKKIVFGHAIPTKDEDYDYAPKMSILYNNCPLSSSTVKNHAYTIDIDQLGVLTVTRHFNNTVICRIRISSFKDIKIIKDEQKDYGFIILCIIFSLSTIILAVLLCIFYYPRVSHGRLYKGDKLFATDAIKIDGRFYRFPYWLIPDHDPRYNHYMIMQNDGNLVIYEADIPIWSSKTKDCYRVEFENSFKFKLFCEKETKEFEYQKKDSSIYCNSDNECITLSSCSSFWGNSDPPSGGQSSPPPSLSSSSLSFPYS